MTSLNIFVEYTIGLVHEDCVSRFPPPSIFCKCFHFLFKYRNRKSFRQNFYKNYELCLGTTYKIDLETFL